MISVTSLSGGKSSAYIAANYPTDFYVFALVLINEVKAAPKDKKLIKEASERLGKDFIATAEDDVIITTMLDLEQELGKPIEWVSGKPFDDLRKNSLPNINWRHCTELMKIKPLFDWWKRRFNGQPVTMNIGFRQGEERRAANMLAKCNEDGLRAYNGTYWQKPAFPMIENGIRKSEVVEYWKDSGVRFADRNNCVHCFHRNPLVLRKMWDIHPAKMEWAAEMEKRKGAQWKKEISYLDIKKHKPQHEINFKDFPCDSGACGL